MESNRLCLERFYAAVVGGDHVAAESLLHAEFTVHEAGGLPYAGVYKGPRAWWQLFARISGIWLDLKIENLDLIGEPDGELFGWYMRMSGRSAATGKPFATTIFERWVVKGGKLMEVRPHYWDTKTLADLNSP